MSVKYLAQGISLAALAMSTVATAQAQESAAEGEYTGIVVTAQKRAENVQDIPKSVDVISAERLEDSGVTRLTELSRISPSISGSAAPVTGTPAIRGVSSFAFSIGLQGQTGVVVDDIPQPAFSSLANELSDIERVEVFPGPQSTLSGRNAAGGLINIVTRKPSFDFSARFSAEQTTDHQTRAQGFLTGPISNNLAFSVSAFANKWDGPLFNLGTNERVGGFNTWGVRGKLLWKPTDKLDVTLIGYYIKNKTTSPALISGSAYVSLDPTARYQFNPVPTVAQLLPGVEPGPFNRNVYSPANSVSRTKDRGVALQLDLDVGDLGTVRSISNWSQSDLPRRDRFIGPDIGLADPYVDVTYNSKVISQEVRLVSPDKQPFTYIIGAIYSDNDINHPYRRLGIFPANWVRGSGFASIATYGRGTFDFGQGTSLTGGLRYQHDAQKWNWTFLGTTAPYPVTSVRGGNSKYDFVSGEVSLRHAFTDTINAYVTLSRSETGRAYDLEDQTNAQSATGLQPITSEKVKNVEVGLKMQSADRRLTANFNAFYADYENYQIQTTEPLINANQVPVIRLFAIGKVVTKGVEFIGSYAPVDDLVLNFNAAYLDAQIKDYPNAACYARQTVAQGCVGGLQANLAGLSMPNTPKFNFNASVDYTLRLPSAPFDARFNVFGRYVGSRHSDLFGNPLSNLPSFMVVNTSIGLADHDDKYELTFFVNNLFNKKYYTSLGDDTFFNVAGSATTPAVVAGYARDSFRYGGVRLTAKF